MDANQLVRWQVGVDSSEILDSNNFNKMNYISI